MYEFFAIHFTVKAILTLVVAVGILTPCFWYTIRPGSQPGPIPIEYFIAFNLTNFIVLGFAVTIIAADRWAAASLWAGAAMLGGGVVGILFGLPSAADTQNTQADQAAAVAAVKDAVVQAQGGEAKAPVPARRHTLLGDTASWMSKFLAGAGFAQARTLLDNFRHLSRTVSGFVVNQPLPPNYSALGGGLLLYFGILGFLCGLILPGYYVKNLPGE